MRAAINFQGCLMKNIFSGLTQDHSYRIIRLIVLLTFTTAIIGLIAWASIAIFKSVNKSELSVPGQADEIAHSLAVINANKVLSKLNVNVSKGYLESVLGPPMKFNEHKSKWGTKYEAIYFDYLYCLQIIYYKDRDGGLLSDLYSVISLNQNYRPEIPIIRKPIGSGAFSYFLNNPQYTFGFAGANRFGYEEADTLSLGGGLFKTVFLIWNKEAAEYTNIDKIPGELIRNLYDFHSYSGNYDINSEEVKRSHKDWRALVHPNGYAVTNTNLPESKEEFIKQFPLHIGVPDWVIEGHR